MFKAVIVGINSYPSAPLQGCVNDANDVIDYIVKNELVAAGDIFPLYDGRATKAAIVSALGDMIKSSSPGDHLLFHYSGHGTRIPSQTASDGYEEALCPVDFDWSDLSTALTANEFIAIVNTVPAGTALTVVTDACHSAGLSDRDLATKVRFYPPPPDIAFLLQSRKRAVRPRDLSSANAILVAACQSDETAADTSFANRPNGAFTYNWLKEMSKSKTLTIDDLVAKVTGDVQQYSMHPSDDGPSGLKTATFLISPPPVPRDFGLPAVVARAEVVFDQSWSVTVLGTRVGVELQVSIVDGGFEFLLSSDSGVPLRWSFKVNGNTSQRVELGYGFALVLAVSGWTATPGSVGFDLAIQVAPPFFGPVTITQQHVTLPVAALPRALAVPASPADLFAMIQLAQLGYSQEPIPVPPAVVPRDGSDQFTGIACYESFAGGLFGCSYNKNSNDGGNSSYVPPGFIRDHVEVVLDPPNSGNVHFNRWLDSDPHLGNFEFHVGCSSCRGGRATFYLHCVRDPNVTRQLAATVTAPAARPQPAKLTNGHARSEDLGAALEMDQPEAGGSIRA